MFLKQPNVINGLKLERCFIWQSQQNHSILSIPQEDDNGYFLVVTLSTISSVYQLGHGVKEPNFSWIFSFLVTPF
jgi:hypothetical protein